MLSIWSIVGIFVVLNIGIILLTSVETFRGAKTWFTGIITAAVGAIQATGIDFIDDPQTFGVAMIGLGVTMAVLREVTKKSPR